MKPGQLLDRIRELYLDTFVEAIESCSKDVSVKVVAEAPFVTSDGEVIGSGPHDLPLRTDIIVIESGEVKENIRAGCKTTLPPRISSDGKGSIVTACWTKR